MSSGWISKDKKLSDSGSHSVSGSALRQSISTFICVRVFMRVCAYVCAYMYVCVYVRVCIWKSEADLQESVLSIHNVAPGVRTQVVGFSGKCLYPQSHLTSP